MPGRGLPGHVSPPPTNQGHLHGLSNGANGVGGDGCACAASRIEVQAPKPQHFAREGCGDREFWFGQRNGQAGRHVGRRSEGRVPNEHVAGGHSFQWTRQWWGRPRRGANEEVRIPAGNQAEETAWRRRVREIWLGAPGKSTTGSESPRFNSCTTRSVLSSVTRLPPTKTSVASLD